MVNTPFIHPTYQLGDWMGNAYDDAGCQWIVKRQSLIGAPTMKIRATERNSRMGGHRRRSHMGMKRGALQGVCIAPTRLELARAKDRMASLFSDGDQVELIYDDGWAPRSVLVEQDGKSEPQDIPGIAFTFNLPLLAADPRMRGLEEKSATITPAAASSGGLDWATGGGLDWDPGLDWGSVTSTGEMTLDNNGSAKEWPVLYLNGPLGAGATIRSPETGRMITYAPALLTGDVLRIDNSEFTRSALLNGVTDRFPSLTPYAQWFEIPKHSSIRLILSATGTGNLSATWHDAYVM